MNVKRGTVLSLASLLAALVLMLPDTAVAATWESSRGNNSPVADQLKDFKGIALEMRREADILNSFALNHRLNWQSHSMRHVTLQEYINRMGEILAQLEAQKSSANDSQRMAIEQVRPHLVAAADNLTQVMEMVQDNRSTVAHPDYAESVQGLASHSDDLYEKLDAILDHESTKLRLDNVIG